MLVVFPSKPLTILDSKLTSHNSLRVGCLFNLCVAKPLLSFACAVHCALQDTTELKAFCFWSEKNMCDESASYIYIGGIGLAKPRDYLSTKALFPLTSFVNKNGIVALLTRIIFFAFFAV